MTHARPMYLPPGRLLWLPFAACALWLALTVGLYHQALHAEAVHRLELERTRLATVARQLLDVRNWNAAHGGVYVRQSPYGSPNPWLPEKERTLITAEGQTLVLMNPAYMSRQLAERVAEPGLAINIVSPQPLRPGNLADPWERDALARCTENAHEIFTPPQVDNQGRLRLLSVLIARPDCLRCHQDRHEGEILGGISVSQDAAAYLRGLDEQTRRMRLLYGLLGLTGVLGIGGTSLYLTRRRWLAEETSRLKSVLLARLGHDMRTPLTAMLGMSELLRRPDVRPVEKNHALDYLTQAGGALLEMVSDITDHAALELAAPPLRSAPFRLRACLDECLALYRPVAEAKGLSLLLTVSPDVPDAVEGDCFRLRQALGNLVSNAVKFTGHGGVRVDVLARHCGQDGRDLRCALAVTDTGPGLPLEEQERVFANFQRGAAAAHCPGTGLGLGMARQLARRMGGDVRLHSSPGQGACFTLEVRLRAAPKQTAGDEATPPPQTPPTAWATANTAVSDAPGAPATANVAEGTFSGLRVLLVEDNPATAYYLRQMLIRAGAATHLLTDGNAALDLLRDPAQGPWDVLLLDACLPGRNGPEVLEAVRRGRTAVPRDQKVLLCTASSATDNAIVTPRHTGLVDGLLCKPFTFATLRQALCALLGPTTASPLHSQEINTPGTPTAAATPRPPGGAPPVDAACPPDKDTAAAPHAATPPVWDRQAALAAVDHDPSLLAQLAAVAAQDLRERAALLGTLPPDAPHALELRHLAHACKNTAGSLCLENLRQAAARLEQARPQNLAAASAALAAALHLALEALEG